MAAARLSTHPSYDMVSGRGMAGGMMGKSSNASHGLVVSGGCDPMVLRMIIMVECKALYSH